jgi:hypothetical protein
MVKRERETTSRKIDKSNENENPALLSAPPSKPNDDLIISLSDAYENKRARQVVEWEKLGRQKIQPTI